MIPVTFLRKLAAAASPDKVMVYSFVLLGALTLVIGCIRARKAFLTSLPGLFYFLLSVLLLPPWLTGRIRIALMVLAGIGLGAHLIIHRPKPEEAKEEAKPDEKVTPVSRRIGWIYLGVTLALVTVFLLDDLGGYAGTLLVWESPVSRGFGEAFRGGQSVWSYAGRRFIWEDGLMSSGQNSFLYGAPTYALFHLFGFNRWTLRIVAALLAILSIPVAYALGRRFFSPLIGGALAILFAFDTNILFYGRYGTSSSATLLGSLLALFCTWLFLDHRYPKWWMGPLCGLALYLATLQYATARLLVLILLAMIPAVLVVEWRRFNVKRAIGFAVILLWVVGVWNFEKHHGAERAYVHARGEQYFTFLKEPGYFRDFTGRTHDPNRITLQDRFDLLKGVLKRTVPQFRWFVSPQTDLRTNSILEGDPPRIPLYSAALFPFLLWGLGYSLFRLRSWRYSLPVVWVALATGPLLLTNRVDAHRIMVFVIPFTLWIAFGVGDAAQIMRRGKAPRWLQHTFAIFLALILLWKNSVLLFWESPPISRTCEVLTEEIQKIEGPLRVGVRGDHREISLVNLALLERTRRNPENTGLMIPPELTDRLGDDNAPDRRQADGGMNWMTSFLQEATVIMAPSTQFRSLSDALAAAGYKVISFTKKGYPFFVVQRDRRDADKAISGLLTDTEEGKLSSLEVWKGKKIWLDELQAKDVQYGFQPPMNNCSWDGTPIRMDDVIYGHGIGMHAWCKSTYDVSEKAVAFQALAGFSDAVRDRTTTEMTFEIWDEQNRRLYYSGFVTPAKGSRQVFVELKDSKQITLVVTEGRDGRDCDHANWAEAAFLLPPE